jgi:hypothetical protein
MLEKGEILTESRGGVADKTTRLRLRAVTFNNFGCYYKEKRNLNSALGCVRSIVNRERECVCVCVCVCVFVCYGRIIKRRGQCVR